MSIRCKSIILLSLLAYAVDSSAQSPLSLKRSAPSVLARDANVQGYQVVIIPVVPDTASALTYGVDSLGMLIQVRATGKQYKRDTVPTGGHVWTEIGSSSGSTYTADESSIHLSTGQFSIKGTYPGQSSITTLGTIGAGIWQGTAIGDTYISSAATWNAKLSAASTANTVTGNGTSGSPVQLVGDAASPGNSMYYGTNGSGAKGFYTLPSGVAAANPTTSIGLTPTNGSASTFMRSDAAPSLSQSITPTWTGAHAFNGSITMGSNIAFSANNTYQIGASAAAASHLWSRAFNSDAAATLSSTTGSPASMAIGANSGITLLSTGQAQLNNYTTSTSFAGTPLAFLQNDASGNIVQTPLSSIQSALSGAGYVKFSGTTPSYLTPTQATADLNVFTTSLQGLAPASGGGTTNFLRADGSWGVPPGTGGVTFANPSAAAGLSAVNGSASTAMRSDGSPAISQSISPTWSGTHTFSNAPVMSTLTGYIKGNGALALTASSTVPLGDMATIAAHSYVGNNTGSTATPAAITATQITADLNVFTTSLKGLAPSSGGGTTNFLRADGTWAAPPGGGTAANPSASLGLSAVNGSATTYMRSDAAPALDVTISPTWSGNHTFANSVVVSNGTLTSYLGDDFFGSSSNNPFRGFVNGTQYFQFNKPSASYDAGITIASKGWTSLDSCDFNLSSRPVTLGGPVAMLYPNKANKWMSFDIMPSDSNAEYLTNGNAWMDIGDAQLTNGQGYVGTFRAQASHTTGIQFGAMGFGGKPTPKLSMIWGVTNPIMTFDVTGYKWFAKRWAMTADTPGYATYYLTNPNAGSTAGMALNISPNGGSDGMDIFGLWGSSYTSAPFDAGVGLYAKGTRQMTFVTNSTQPIRFATSGTPRAQFDGATGAFLWGTTTNAASSAMTISSTAKGVLLPRMTTTQQNAISSPATGLLLYNTDTADYMQYNASAWKRVGGPGGGGGLSLPLTDNNNLFANNSDVTKLVKFDLSGQTTGTTRTYSFPNASTGIPGLGTANTFTNANNAFAGLSVSGSASFTASAFFKQINGVGNGSSAPTFSLQSGAGTGSSLTIDGTDVAGYFQLVTGTGTSTGAQVVWTFNAANFSSTGAGIILWPRNAAAAPTVTYGSLTTGTTWTFSASTALPASTTLQYNYIVIGM